MATKVLNGTVYELTVEEIAQRELDAIESAEAWATDVRSERDMRLAATDFRMASDAPWDKTPWVTYRQSLRDLPQQPGFPWTPETVPWPELPM